MGFTVLGAIIILTGWFALVEYDQSPEEEKKRIVARIKESGLAKLVISLMPVGILINILGSAIGSIWLIVLGATLIFIQSIIVSLWFWNRKRWKSIVLLIGMLILGGLMYIPFFMELG